MIGAIVGILPGPDVVIAKKKEEGRSTKFQVGKKSKFEKKKTEILDGKSRSSKKKKTRKIGRRRRRRRRGDPRGPANLRKLRKEENEID